MVCSIYVITQKQGGVELNSIFVDISSVRRPSFSGREKRVK